jgi:hypothetical protein
MERGQEGRAGEGRDLHSDQMRWYKAQRRNITSHPTHNGLHRPAIELPVIDDCNERFIANGSWCQRHNTTQHYTATKPDTTRQRSGESAKLCEGKEGRKERKRL